MGKGPSKSSANLNNKVKVKLVKGKPNLRVACPKGKLEFKFFPSPVWDDNLCITCACGTGTSNLYPIAKTVDNRKSNFWAWPLHKAATMMY